MVTDETTAEDVLVREVAAAGAYTEDVRRLAGEGKNQLLTSRGLPLWWVEGRPGALLLKYGRGRVLLVADSSLLTARGLRREDNAVVLYNIALRHARQGKVFFDEYHHGLHSVGGFWGYLAHYGAHWALVPLGWLLLMAGWAVAVRLGPAQPMPPQERADAVDYASAVARIYEQAGVRRLPARALVQGFLAALTHHLHLRRQALPAEILAAWQQQHPGASGQQLQTLLRGLSQLRQGKVSDKQLLAWSQAFDRFQAEVMCAR